MLFEWMLTLFLSSNTKKFVSDVSIWNVTFRYHAHVEGLSVVLFWALHPEILLSVKHVVIVLATDICFSVLTNSIKCVLPKLNFVLHEIVTDYYCLSSAFIILLFILVIHGCFFLII